MDLLTNDTSNEKIKDLVKTIRARLNPNPGGQIEFNIPSIDQKPISGIQHKYKQTVLLFPAAGQSCHAYCTFCFRWPQFVGRQDWSFKIQDLELVWKYLLKHQEVTDVLMTGGDPMIMSASQLALYIEPLLGQGFEHIETIRIGTKSIAYWPYRYVTDTDATDLLHLSEKVVSAGKHLALMGHYEHWKELDTPISREAIRLIRISGAEIRTQAPIVRHINNDPEIWAKMWQLQVCLGCIPYYMFIERPTGANKYFEIPLAQCLDIYRQALQQVSGLSRTVRGPVMSALPGKICIDGVTEISNEKLFVLSFLQGRDSNWCKRPFFAEFSDQATWLTDLNPAFNQKRFFYESELNEILQ